jgi:transglutaminase-like putative cysteine protease/tetratricopeptide (TPR) repeat protein
MLRTALLFAFILGALVPGFEAQAPAKASDRDLYRNETIVIEHSETTYRMHADGTGERDLHVNMRIQSDGAAQQFGVLGFPYASANEAPVVKFVRVHKPDGSIVDTPAADAMDMPADVTRQAPLYSDLKEKHIPVRSLAAGDTLEYEIDTTINKPEAPGQFWGTYHFTAPGTVVVLAEVLTVEVPAEKYVQVWSPNHKPDVTEHDGLRTYVWNMAQLVIAPKSSGDESTKPTPPRDPDEDADGRKLPSVAWTTFHTWAEVGEWYRSLALKQADPDDMLRARADEITQNAKTPEDQVRALYDFVSTHIRYVGIDFGIGRYQPHSAAEVLANQYGDCKDKDTLLEALLRSKGFSTAPALVGAGIAPVPDVPSPAVFNHAITTVNLPGGRIWLDSTPLAAPYRYLSAVIRDQKALIVPADGAAALEATPKNAPYPFTARFEATGTLDSDGKLTAKMTATYRDDNEVLVRALARSVAPADWDKISQYISASTGFGGTTSNTLFTNQSDASQPIVLTYDYSRHPFGDWGNLRIIPLFPALEFATLESDTSTPQDDIQLGAPRTLTAISHIHLPEGYRPDLPDPIHVKTDFATFDKTYRFEGNEIIAERDIVVLKDKIAKADWQQYQKFTKDISLSDENWIQLMHSAKPAPSIVMKPGKPPIIKKSDDGTVTIQLQPEEPATSKPRTPADGAPPATDASATELMKMVEEKFRARDWDGARLLLDQVKAKNPNEENLWTAYGALAEFSEMNYQRAIEDFRKELAAHPDNGRAVGMLADAQTRSGDASGARQSVQQYFERHPDNAQLAMYLANLQTIANDNAGALKTLQTAADHNPDDRNIRVELSQVLVDLNRMDEAAAASKSALDGTDDPMVLNNAAYTLSETGMDLPIAEDASRRSIAKYEEKSAAVTTETANSSAFSDAQVLVAAWDTLGWILFEEGKLDQAWPLVSATWRAGLQAESGDHLGQIDEAAGHKDEAAADYALAQAAIDKNTPPVVRRHIAESTMRLKAAGAKPGLANGVQTLQDLRTYKIKRPAGVSGWGTFRLEISTAGVLESQQMSGEQHLAAVKPEVDAMKFPELLPPDSKAHLLRSAVVSCSMGTTCEVVLVPNGDLQTEQN